MYNNKNPQTPVLSQPTRACGQHIYQTHIHTTVLVLETRIKTGKTAKALHNFVLLYGEALI